MLCPCFKCESGLKKTKMTGSDMHVARQTAFFCYNLGTASLSQIQFTFHGTSMKQKFLIYEDCVITSSKSFYSDLSDKSNDDPQFRAGHNLPTRCRANIDKLRGPSICQPKAHGAGPGRKPKAPKVRQERLVWFVDIRKFSNAWRVAYKKACQFALKNHLITFHISFWDFYADVCESIHNILSQVA